MKKEYILQLLEETYSLPCDTEEDICNLQEKIIHAGKNVDEQQIETLLKFIFLNTFAQSLN